ncbi:OmpA family protein [Actinoallomurus iriomotensis]|uniref:OmpA family protein n=1 Tax=Actinoallomurus iriomotensis TaxID=478107 RepID=UPI0032DB95F0
MRSPRGVTVPVRVTGFTDDIGTPAANLTLSRARAEAVRAELSGREGPDHRRVEISYQSGWPR